MTNHVTTLDIIASRNGNRNGYYAFGHPSFLFVMRFNALSYRTDTDLLSIFGKSTLGTLHDKLQAANTLL